MTGIQWTDRTWNPVRGCCIVSAGCKNCYAMKQAHRFSRADQPYAGLTRMSLAGPVWTGAARFVPEMLAAPLSWRKPARVFVNSMSDLFHEDLANEQIAAVFGVMAACPQHTFQVLTKRPQRMVEWFKWVAKRADDGLSMFPDDPPSWRIGQMLAVTLRRLAGIDGQRPGTRATLWEDFNPRDQPWPLPNVWLGVSCENQASADERIPLLLQCPATVRFVSAEPLLGPIDFRNIESARNEMMLALAGLTWNVTPHTLARTHAKLDWVIVGGESGPGARVCDVSWIESIVAQCAAAGVSCFVKQLGRRPYDSFFQVGVYAPYDRRTPTGPDGAGGTMAIGNLVLLKDRKGGAMAEWPQNLRVRQWPEAPNG